MLYPFLKRTFDVLMSAVGLLLLIPLGLFIALFIKLSDRGPIFYTQRRIGRFGKPFQIRKFRSMVVNADKIGLAVTKEEDPRITWIGRWLRKTKLDELPQLWNVFVGEMSFVGPRPEVPRYVDAYTAEQREILQHKPGITDMATLMFRNEEALLRGSQDVEAFYLNYCLPRKIELNRNYAERAGFFHDLWIILQTLCPYWIGILVIYTVSLVASVWLTYQLRSDFQMTPGDYAQFWRRLPLMVLPQLVLLFWRRQFRGLLSYFSIREMRQIAAALTFALIVQVGLCRFLLGAMAPTKSFFIINLMVSFLALCSVRMSFRFFRERMGRVRGIAQTPVCRVAIVGTGELATNLAQDLARTNGNGGRHVVAFFGDDPRSWHKRPHDIPVIGMPECILNREWLDQLDEVIVALPDDQSARAREIAALLKGTRLKVSFVSTWPLLQSSPGAPGQAAAPMSL